MSDVSVTARTWALDTNDDFYLKWPAVNQTLGRPYTVIIHLIDHDSGDGTITVKARPSGSTASPVAIPYQSLHLNGSAGTGGLVSTGITATSLIAIEADGLEICLTQASRTTGGMNLTMSVSQMA